MSGKGVPVLLLLHYFKSSQSVSGGRLVPSAELLCWLSWEVGRLSRSCDHLPWAALGEMTQEKLELQRLQQHGPSVSWAPEGLWVSPAEC